MVFLSTQSIYPLLSWPWSDATPSPPSIIISFYAHFIFHFFHYPLTYSNLIPFFPILRFVIDCQRLPSVASTSSTHPHSARRLNTPGRISDQDQYAFTQSTIFENIFRLLISKPWLSPSCLNSQIYPVSLDLPGRSGSETPTALVSLGISALHQLHTCLPTPLHSSRVPSRRLMSQPLMV